MTMPRRNIICYYGSLILALAAIFVAIFQFAVGAILFAVGFIALLVFTVKLRCPSCGEGAPRGVHPGTKSYYCPKCGAHIAIEKQSLRK